MNKSIKENDIRRDLLISWRNMLIAKAESSGLTDSENLWIIQIDNELGIT